MRHGRAVVAVGVGLADPILVIFRSLRREIGEFRERMAKVERMLDGLREAIVGRARLQAAERRRSGLEFRPRRA